MAVGPTRHERVALPDGEMGAHLALPASGSGPGIVVAHEIFGVGSYIRDACRRLAELGYVAMAPDLYWRIEPGVEIAHDESGLRRAMGYSGRLNVAGAITDAVAAVEHLRARPAVAGARSGVLGFCLGGMVAYQVGVQGSPDAVVSYYGSGVADALDSADRIDCPAIFHFGGRDPYIPRAQAEAVCAMAAAREDMECHIHDDAGHAFDNHEAPMFSVPEAAARAWELTRAFLGRALPVG